MPDSNPAHFRPRGSRHSAQDTGGSKSDDSFQRPSDTSPGGSKQPGSRNSTQDLPGSRSQESLQRASDGTPATSKPSGIRPKLFGSKSKERGKSTEWEPSHSVTFSKPENVQVASPSVSISSLKERLNKLARVTPSAAKLQDRFRQGSQHSTRLSNSLQRSQPETNSKNDAHKLQEKIKRLSDPAPKAFNLQDGLSPKTHDKFRRLSTENSNILELQRSILREPGNPSRVSQVRDRPRRVVLDTPTVLKGHPGFLIVPATESNISRLQRKIQKLPPSAFHGGKAQDKRLYRGDPRQELSYQGTSSTSRRTTGLEETIRKVSQNTDSTTKPPDSQSRNPATQAISPHELRDRLLQLVSSGPSGSRRSSINLNLEEARGVQGSRLHTRNLQMPSTSAVSYRPRAGSSSSSSRPQDTSGVRPDAPEQSRVRTDPQGPCVFL